MAARERGRLFQASRRFASKPAPGLWLWCLLLLSCAGVALAPPPKGVTQQQDQEIRGILRMYAQPEEDDEESGILQLCQQLLAVFAAIGWLRNALLPNDAVGVDITNRNGLGVVVSDVYALLGEVKFKGWDDKKCEEAICIEEEPGKTDILERNAQIVRDLSLFALFGAENS